VEFQLDKNVTNLNGGVTFMHVEETRDMHMVVLGCADVKMDISSGGNVLNRSSVRHQIVLDATNASLAPLYLSHLLDEVLAISSKVPCLRTAMFKFTL
jgi:hypothetical protein